MCCIASLIDYFSPLNPRLNSIYRMLLIFRDVLSGTLGLKKKDVSKQQFAFSGTPESFECPRDLRGFGPIGNQARDNISKYKLKLSKMKISN